MTKKKLLILSAFLTIFGMLAVADASAIDRTYTFSGTVTYGTNNQPAANTQVTIWVKWIREVGDGDYDYFTRTSTACTNANGQYRFSYRLNVQWSPVQSGTRLWARPSPINLGGNCKGYYYASGRYNFAAGGNTHNLSLAYEDLCCNSCFDDDEVPEGLPSSWYSTFEQTAPSPGGGGAMNWENRLFGRLPL